MTTTNLSMFSANDLKVLRKVVQRVHGIYFKGTPVEHLEEREIDKIIESLMPETVDKYLTYGKHLQQKSFLPKRSKTAEAVHREIITDGV